MYLWVSQHSGSVNIFLPGHPLNPHSVTSPIPGTNFRIICNADHGSNEIRIFSDIVAGYPAGSTAYNRMFGNIANGEANGSPSTCTTTDPSKVMVQMGGAAPPTVGNYIDAIVNPSGTWYMSGQASVSVLSSNAQIVWE